jgi:predicted dithiol-disulfide oxidoreductase (DUF899 family)
VTHVLRTPKDGVDELIERVKAISRTIEHKPDTQAYRDARIALLEADAALSRARAALARVHQPRPVAT